MSSEDDVYFCFDMNSKNRIVVLKGNDKLTRYQVPCSYSKPKQPTCSKKDKYHPPMKNRVPFAALDLAFFVGTPLSRTIKG